ncbi:ferritin [Alphaproteobacteria bacterium]|nr:ferritin [Alphaproteobacteria bacterium]
MNRELLDLLNEQINAEIYSSFLYLSMSLYCDDMNYRGFASWLAKQYAEEREHAERILKYLQARGEKPVLPMIEAPHQNWTSLLEIFETVLAHEKKVSSMIRNLMKLAVSHEDYETQNMLRWFIDEQIEEEEQSSYLLEKFKKVMNNEAGVMVLDKECGKRTD